ncbi:MAG: AmmeMemoRadiSam system radical SAM enzyme [Patescibacteria group bacterium]|nr:AmmeMemoRadiSam system radical SAM enzyme [Patescibacteria group bacterium]
MKKAILFEKLEGSLVKCLACSWYCKIASKQLGICATRFNEKGSLYSLVYGYVIGPHLDPVEKKPLYHFYPGEKLLSFGTVGCNFGCLFCQNWEMSNLVKNLKLKVKNLKKEIFSFIQSMSQKIIPKEIVEMAVESGAKGIAYTYNEPAIFIEFAYDCMKLAKKRGLKNVFVSNGFESKECFDYIKDYLDAINIDLKSFRSEFYQKICLATIEPVKENIKKYFKAGIETEVTTLVIPGYNDNNEELTAIAKFLKEISTDIPWHVSAFYPAYKMTDVEPTPYETLLKAYEIGKKVGLNYVYVGNVYDPERSSTFCPKCGQLLIERLGYKVEVVGLTKEEVCKKCGKKIYGAY